MQISKDVAIRRRHSQYLDATQTSGVFLRAIRLGGELLSTALEKWDRLMENPSGRMLYFAFKRCRLVLHAGSIHSPETMLSSSQFLCENVSSGRNRVRRLIRSVT